MSRAEVLHWTPIDYLGDYKTQCMSLEAHGAYHLLLWHMWIDSDSQCEFPLDYHALASIWQCAREDAERLVDTLTQGSLAVVKIKQTRNGAVLQSKRLREQREQAEKAHANKVAGGVASGAARRAKSRNTGRTDNEQRSTNDELTYHVSRKHVSRNHVARTCSEPPPPFVADLKCFEQRPASSYKGHGRNDTALKILYAEWQQRFGVPSQADLSSLRGMVLDGCFPGCPKTPEQVDECLACALKAVREKLSAPGGKVNYALGRKVMREDRKEAS